jgi:hypothetical protein
MKQSPSRKQHTFILWLVACLIIAGIPAAMAVTETGSASSTGGTITVVSYPSGAAVSLNGEYRGVTPAEYDNLPPGDYLISVALAGYKTETVPTHLWDGSRSDLMVQLENASQAQTPGPLSRFGSIAVDSTPGGASVFLDGNAAGKTPVTRAALILNTIPVGDHTIRVELAGYPPFTGTVTVMKNQVSRINAELSISSPPETSAAIPASASATSAPAAPTQKSGLPPAIVIGAVGLIGLAAVFRRS